MSNKYFEAITKHPLERNLFDNMLCKQYEQLDEYIVVYIRIKIKHPDAIYKEWTVPMSEGVVSALNALEFFKTCCNRSFLICMNLFDLHRMLQSYYEKITVKTQYIDYEPVIMTQERLLEIKAYVGDDTYNHYEEDDYSTLIKREAVRPSDYWLMRDAFAKEQTPF